MSIKIITDSTSYIPQEYIDKYDIKVISLNVVMDLDSRRELDIDNITFYDEMDKASEIPKSSQPIPEGNTREWRFYSRYFLIFKNEWYIFKCMHDEKHIITRLSKC